MALSVTLASLDYLALSKEQVLSRFLILFRCRRKRDPDFVRLLLCTLSGWRPVFPVEVVLSCALSIIGSQHNTAVCSGRAHRDQNYDISSIKAFTAIEH